MSVNKDNKFLSCIGIFFGIALIIGSFTFIRINEREAVISYLTREFAKNNYVKIDADHIQAENDKKLVLLSGKTSTEDILTDSIFNVSVDNSMSLNRIVEMYQWIETKHKHTSGSGRNKRTYYTYTYDLGWSRGIINSATFHSGGHENPRIMFHKNESVVSKNIKIGAFRVASEVVRSINPAERIDIDPTKVTLSGTLKLRNNKIFYNVYAEEKNRKKDKTSPAANRFKEDYEVNEKAPNLGDIRIYFTKNPVCEVTVLGEQREDKILPFKSEYQVIFEACLNKVSITELLRKKENADNVRKWFVRIIFFFILSGGLFLVSSRMKNNGCLFSLILSFTIVNGIIAVCWLPHHIASGLYSLGLMVIGGVISIFLFMKAIGESSNSVGRRNFNNSYNNRFKNNNSFANNSNWDNNNRVRDNNNFGNDSGWNGDNRFRDSNSFGNNSGLDNSFGHNDNYGNNDDYSRNYDRNDYK